jgi:arylsulfatase A-like enzyme
VKGDRFPEINKLWEKRGSEKFEYKLLASLYDGEIAYVDECVGALMHAFQEYHLEDKTTVIITADHGESHGEHDSIFNHGDLHEPTVHVPLIMKNTSLLPAGEVTNELVENIDLVPTIFDIFGVDKPAELEGKSLLPRLTGESSEPVRKEVFSETGLAQCARMISDGKWKLIETIHRGLWEKPENPELYNLEKDPLEMKSISQEEKEKTEELQLRLHRSVAARLGSRPDPLRLAAKWKGKNGPIGCVNMMKQLGITDQDLKALRKKHGIDS